MAGGNLNIVHIKNEKISSCMYKMTCFLVPQESNSEANNGIYIYSFRIYINAVRPDYQDIHND